MRKYIVDEHTLLELMNESNVLQTVLCKLDAEGWEKYGKYLEGFVSLKNVPSKFEEAL